MKLKLNLLAILMAVSLASWGQAQKSSSGVYEYDYNAQGVDGTIKVYILDDTGKRIATMIPGPVSKWQYESAPAVLDRLFMALLTDGIRRDINSLKEIEDHQSVFKELREIYSQALDTIDQLREALRWRDSAVDFYRRIANEYESTIMHDFREYCEQKNEIDSLKTKLKGYEWLFNQPAQYTQMVDDTVRIDSLPFFSEFGHDNFRSGWARPLDTVYTGFTVDTATLSREVKIIPADNGKELYRIIDWHFYKIETCQDYKDFLIDFPEYQIPVKIKQKFLHCFTPKKKKNESRRH